MKVGNKLTRVYARVYVCMYVGKHVCLRIPCVRYGSVYPTRFVLSISDGVRLI